MTRSTKAKATRAAFKVNKKNMGTDDTAGPELGPPPSQDQLSRFLRWQWYARRRIAEWWVRQ